MDAGVAVAAADAIASLVAGISDRGYAVAAAALPPGIIADLRGRALALDGVGAMTPGGVGRGPARLDRADVRGDRLAWLADPPHDAAEVAALARFEELRRACNRALTLGLFEFESHYSLYAPGASYGRHRDRFRDDDARVLSCVLYLNDGWQPGDGGALRVHLPDGDTLDVAPIGGTLVAFLSEAFEHEVLPAVRTRMALTGWFRTRRA